MRLACALLLSVTGAASAFAADTPHSRCFPASDFRNWHAADAKTVYIRAAVERIYRVYLGRDCPTIMWPDAHLILKTHGGSDICSPLDIDLRVGQGTGGGVPDRCFVKSLTELAPDEAAALPKGMKP